MKSSARKTWFSWVFESTQKRVEKARMEIEMRSIRRENQAWTEFVQRLALMFELS